MPTPYAGEWEEALKAAQELGAGAQTAEALLRWKEKGRQEVISADLLGRWLRRGHAEGLRETAVMLQRFSESMLAKARAVAPDPEALDALTQGSASAQ